MKTHRSTDNSMRRGPSAEATDIIHLDLDCFFAAVETLERPDLRGMPVIVGGTGDRGVVASASYEARGYGVHSAMPTAQARQICPTGVFLSPNFSLYRALHDRLIEIFESVTPLVEPVALDEAFLDVSGAHGVWGSSREIAETLRRRVQEDLALSCSVGVGRTKLVAKLASKAAKPTATRAGPRSGIGVLVVGPNEELAFIQGHRVRALPGVGPRTEDRLARLGISTVADLAEISPSTLISHFGRAHGQLLCDLASGLDERPVVVERALRSIGHEETFEVDEFEVGALISRAKALAVSVATRCRDAGCAGKTVSIKLRYGDFSGVTRSRTTGKLITTSVEIAEVAEELLGDLDVARGVRLFGIALSGLEPLGKEPARQLLLFGAETGEGASLNGQRTNREGLEQTADEIRRRFGEAAIGTTANVKSKATRPPSKARSKHVQKGP